MTNIEFFALLDHICNEPEGTIKGPESPYRSGMVDSMAMLELIAVLDERFGINMTPQQVEQLKSFDEFYEKIHDELAEVACTRPRLGR